MLMVFVIYIYYLQFYYEVSNVEQWLGGTCRSLAFLALFTVILFL